MIGRYSPQEKDCKDLIEKAMLGFGCIDALVNNAGRTMWTKLQRLSIIEQLMRINYLGAAY